MMIHILIDNSTYPYAQIVGVYRDYVTAQDNFTGEEMEIVTWDIVNNKFIHPNDFDGGGDGGTPAMANAA